MSKRRGPRRLLSPKFALQVKDVGYRKNTQCAPKRKILFKRALSLGLRARYSPWLPARCCSASAGAEVCGRPPVCADHR